MCSIENLSVRTHIPHIISRFNITLQIVSVILQIVHVATVAAVQLAWGSLGQTLHSQGKAYFLIFLHFPLRVEGLIQTKLGDALTE